eukprot:CAMPEP_0172716594 /NCGR_PEP_ID=MMETSP1074-20121228/68884_1 /TAXON_ID=2916 /ORGANISM="Ceratium fusus, Strain PA161109" /LENGTH=122 /DNA_ID=CAMNT_0013541335 /DNA_START=122 /DNA_END=491 /DNA_ORIENTATION=-
MMLLENLGRPTWQQDWSRISATPVMRPVACRKQQTSGHDRAPVKGTAARCQVSQHNLHLGTKSSHQALEDFEGKRFLAGMGLCLDCGLWMNQWTNLSSRAQYNALVFLSTFAVAVRKNAAWM